MPWTCHRHPAAIDRVKDGLAHGAIVRRQRPIRIVPHQMREIRQRKRRLHLARMILRLIEDRGIDIVQHPEPVDQENLNVLAGQLPQQRFELIATVTVQQHDFRDP